MNYSRNIRRELIAKRVILLCFAFLVIGFGVGYALRTHITTKSEPKADKPTYEWEQFEFAVYGAYDNRSLPEAMLEWNVELEFQPLDVPMDAEQQEFLFYLCKGYNIDFALIMALIQHESEFRCDVVSSTKDYGLMQINEMNHEWLTETLGVTDYLDPYQNIRAGMFILRELFEKYKESDMVLMAYNMGEDGAERLWQQDIYSTSYTEAILKYQLKFIEQLEGNADAEKLEDS